MVALELLTVLEARGVTLSIQAGQLTSRGPVGAITPDLGEQIKANKAALLVVLLKNPLFLGQQPGRCGSCAHWTPGPWVAHMGFCDVGRKAHDFDGTTEPVEIQIAHTCVVKNGKGWSPR